VFCPLRSFPANPPASKMESRWGLVEEKVARQAVGRSESASHSKELAGPTYERFSRVFDVLELLVGHREGLTLTDISRRLNLPTSSTHNLMQKMVANGMVAVTTDLRYSLGARSVQLGVRINEGLEVRSLAQRHLSELAHDTGCDAYLAMALGRKVSYVDRAEGGNPVNVTIKLGQTLYLHATAAGKLYASYVDMFRQDLLTKDWPKLTGFTLVDREELELECAKIRVQGYAISREEAYLGVVGVAVPVCDARGNLVAALHCPLLQNDSSEGHISFVLKAAQAAARRVEEGLGRARISAL
jgi:IclR family acetate operon transcriptional repressor